MAILYPCGCVDKAKQIYCKNYKTKAMKKIKVINIEGQEQELERYTCERLNQEGHWK